MDINEVRNAVALKMKESSNKELNVNAFNALLSLIGLQSLGKIFLGRREVKAQLKQSIETEAILELLCKIEAGASEAALKLKAGGASVNIVDGKIEVVGATAEHIVGLNIQGSRATILKPGTHIRVADSNAKSITGVRIGGDVQ